MSEETKQQEQAREYADFFPARKRKVEIEDYLVLLFELKPQLNGLPTQDVLDALNQEFKTKFSYRHLSLVYEPIIEFETIVDDFEEEDYFENK